MRNEYAESEDDVSTLTEVMLQRAEALRIARAVLERRAVGGSFLTPGATEPGRAFDLVSMASWIVTGAMGFPLTSAEIVPDWQRGDLTDEEMAAEFGPCQHPGVPGDALMATLDFWGCSACGAVLKDTYGIAPKGPWRRTEPWGKETRVPRSRPDAPEADVARVPTGNRWSERLPVESDVARAPDVPKDYPAEKRTDFFWPISNGTTRAALIVDRDGAGITAKVVGMLRAFGDYEPGVWAEVGIPAPAPAAPDQHVVVKVGDHHMALRDGDSLTWRQPDPITPAERERMAAAATASPGAPGWVQDIADEVNRQNQLGEDPHA